MDSLPLYDLNDLFVRRVTLLDARRMVDAGQAQPLMPGGWRDRHDIPWTGIRLIVARDFEWSRTALNDADAHRAAGEFGDDTDPDFKAKLLLWRFIGDDRAPRVIG